MRSEKRKRWIACFCLWIIPAFLLLTLIRVQCVRFDPNLSPEYIVRRLGKGVGTVTDRSGAILYDGYAVTEPEIMGNLIGSNNRFITNAIAYRYGYKTIPGKIGLINGISALRMRDFREIRTSLLNESAQRAIVQAFGNKMGCCFSYNYKTGEVYTMLSLPSLDRDSGNFTETDNKKMYLVNRCLSNNLNPLISQGKRA